MKFATKPIQHYPPHLRHLRHIWKQNASGTEGFRCWWH